MRKLKSERLKQPKAKHTQGKAGAHRQILMGLKSEADSSRPITFFSFGGWGNGGGGGGGGRG